MHLVFFGLVVFNQREVNKSRPSRRSNSILYCFGRPLLTPMKSSNEPWFHPEPNQLKIQFISTQSAALEAVQARNCSNLPLKWRQLGDPIASASCFTVLNYRGVGAKNSASAADSPPGTGVGFSGRE